MTSGNLQATTKLHFRVPGFRPGVGLLQQGHGHKPQLLLAVTVLKISPKQRWTHQSLCVSLAFPFLSLPVTFILLGYIKTFIFPQHLPKQENRDKSLMMDEGRVQSTHSIPFLWLFSVQNGSPSCLEFQAQEQSWILKSESNQDTGPRETQQQRWDPIAEPHWIQVPPFLPVSGNKDAGVVPHVNHSSRGHPFGF